MQVLLQCSRMYFLCAVACQVTAMHWSAPGLLGLLRLFFLLFLSLPISSMLTKDCCCMQADSQSAVDMLEQSCAASFTLTSSHTSHLLHNMRAMWRAALQFCGAYHYFPIHTRKLWESHGAHRKILKEFSCG